MSDRKSLVKSPLAAGLRAIADASSFGFVAYTTSALPDRVYTRLDAAERPPSVLHGEPDIDVTHLPTPLDYLLRPDLQADNVPTETRRTIGRLEALWLLTEDRYRVLDTDDIRPLAHQASLVEHILSSPHLTRVLIADEVGLGKTLEAGLIIKRLQDRSAVPVRTLYLTEARLVSNVCEEFGRLALRVREWSTTSQEARLVPGDSDPLVVASMHRAVVNAELVGNSGPWDMLIIDEAHHLTDWSEDGSDPQQRMRLVRKLIRERLVPGGRVILMSGTPHQGSEERFKNLLKLLDEGEQATGAKGRVIYRIKDDIRDWDGQPLFPKRQVNPPTQIDAGPKYTEWLSAVHELLTPEPGSRAMGWRRAMALQWCASSPQAGLAFLLRLALRSGLTRRALPVMADAMLALRPYRGGSTSDPVEAIEARLLERQTVIEGPPDDVFQDAERQLPQVLRIGLDLVLEDALQCKLERVFDWLRTEPDEKFVIFAQPVDTVYTLKHRLELELGKNAVWLIVGGQEAAVRKGEIERFLKDSSRRVLVSSRSGGEGINLQVARRLVHFDVPWNPMEMEQRVGRVHRYGSADTAIIDTLVLKESRELRVLARSRARLGKIARDLDADRLEVLFSRTMSLIPLDELAGLMAGENFGPLSPDDEQRIDHLITDGYQRWVERDKEFRGKSEKLQKVDRGAVTDEDFRAFLTSSIGATTAPGWRRKSFVVDDDGRQMLVRTPAEVLQLPGGEPVYVGRDMGAGLEGPSGSKNPSPGGLNHPEISQLVRERIGEVDKAGSSRPLPSGAGSVLIAADDWSNFLKALSDSSGLKAGGILLSYLVRSLDTGASMTELSSSIHYWLTSADATHAVSLDPDQAAQLLRALRAPRPKRQLPSHIAPDALRGREAEFVQSLRRKQPSDPLRAVFPIAAVWIEPTTERLATSEA